MTQQKVELSSLFRPVADRNAVCKCCGATAPLFGVIDFNRNCANVVFEGGLSGIPVYYYRCPACQFLFTTACDEFTPDQFRHWIYNSEYILVDPEYSSVRPARNATEINKLLRNSKTIRILDYGGGSGLCASLLLQNGFTSVVCYDPLVPGIATRPTGKFGCIFCIEVIEHSTAPKALLADIASMLSESGGIIVMTTLLQPVDFDRQGMNWWYIAPRNGHVSMFSGKSLDAIASPLGLRRISSGENTHMLVNKVPEFAKHWAGLA